jgi:hypothetical protein
MEGPKDINHASLKAYVGKKANRVLGNMSWEQLFERLNKDW